MSLVKKTILIVLTLWISLILFAPKRELYYLLEKRLQKEQIVLSQERIRETALGLTITGGTLSIQGVKVGRIERIAFWTVLVYSDLEIENFKSDPGMAKFIDIEVSHADFRHTLLKPTVLTFFASGSFGDVKGTINLLDRSVKLRWLKTGEISALKPYLKRDNEGWFYERNF